MGTLEELEDDCGACPACARVAKTKCTGCKKVFYCGRECQKKHWKQHKFDCKSLPYKVMLTFMASRVSEIGFLKKPR